MSARKKRTPEPTPPSETPEQTSFRAAAREHPIARRMTLPPFGLALRAGPRSTTSAPQAPETRPVTPPASAPVAPTQPAPEPFPVAPSAPAPSAPAQPAQTDHAQDFYADSAERWATMRRQREAMWWERAAPDRLPQTESKLAHVLLEVLFKHKVPPQSITILLARQQGQGVPYDLQICGEHLACEYPERKLYELAERARRYPAEPESFQGRITSRLPDGTLHNHGWGTIDLAARAPAQAPEGAPWWAQPGAPGAMGAPPPYGAPPPWYGANAPPWGAPPWAAGPWGEDRLSRIERAVYGALAGGAAPGGFYTRAQPATPPPEVASNPLLLKMWESLSQVMIERGKPDPLQEQVFARLLDRAFDDRRDAREGTGGTDRHARLLDKLLDRAVDSMLSPPTHAPPSERTGRIETLPDGTKVAWNKDGEVDATTTAMLEFRDEIKTSAKAIGQRMKATIGGARSNTGATSTNGTSNGTAAREQPLPARGPSSTTTTGTS